jgi:hypothetical protein
LIFGSLDLTNFDRILKNTKIMPAILLEQRIKK